MPNVWLKLSDPFKTFGVFDGMLYAIDRVLCLISTRLRLFVYELMAQPITNKALLPPNLVKNLTFCEIGPGYPDIALMPAREDIKLARFAQGAKCLGAYRKGQLIAYLWFCFNQYEEDEVRCTYELTDTAHSVFDFDLYVIPEHRMGVGFLGLWHGANQYLLERGVKYTFSRLTRFNVASRRAHAHLGWKCVARAIFIQAWRLELMFANIPPFVAMTWGKDSRIKLRLDATVHENLPQPSATEAEGPT